MARPRLHPAPKPGDTYSRWEVLGRAEPEITAGGYPRPMWLCRCACLQERPVAERHLVSGATKSCGCLGLENAKAAKIKHGMSKSAEHGIWRTIKSRCYNPNTEHYPNYGGRGIGMSDEWRHSFEAFHRDMGPRPSSKHSVERRDNSRGYCKDNCYWASLIEQASNKRNNRYVVFEGATVTLEEASRRSGLSSHLLSSRLKRGWPMEFLFAPASAVRGRGARAKLAFLV